MAAELTRPLIERMSDLGNTLFNKDFLLTWNHTDAELEAIILATEALEHIWRAGISARVFDGGLGVSNFRDKSTRTRFSFSSACSLLGLSCQDLDEAKSQVAHGETVRETANMISFVTEIIGIRDDLFLGYGHEYMKEVAESVDAGYSEGVLPQRPGVMNLQCDLDHPTQSLADLMHLKKTFGSLEALRGKKLAMTWAYSPSYGKPMSVPQGIISLMTRYGMDVVLAHPEGYDLVPELVDNSRTFADQSGGSFEVAHSMADAFEGADIVYPKSWAPVTVMQQRTDLLKAGRGKEVEDLEKVCIANNDKYRDWECTEDLMKRTKGGKGLYMHCLPADITDVSCEHGEVAASVFERYRWPTYNEAEHKLYVMAAMMLHTRFEDPAKVLADVVQRAKPRRLG
jgi:knotted carbamoyltransferase YgeW